tara:strand:+ start:1211 stop:2458 length:1248 start_codon:yes stop_codon:yes gene_type:complete
MASVAKREWTYKGETKTAWVVRYKDKAGAHRSRQFDRKKAADDYRRQVENELEAGSHIAPAQTLTLNELAEAYIAAQYSRAARGERKEAGIKNVARGLNHFARNIGHVKLTDLTWQMIASEVDRLRDTNVVFRAFPGHTPKVGRKMANGTIDNSLGWLTSALAWAARRGFVGRNAASEARREIGLLAKAPIETFTIEEMQRVTAAIEAWFENTSRRMPTQRTQAFLRAVVYLAAFCGMRKGEILGLRPDRIDWEAKAITIDASLSEDDHLGPTKTVSGIRIVPMPDPVMAALREWEPYMLANERGLIFRTSLNTNPSSQDFYDKWYKLLRAAGIPKTDRGNRNFHALRHFAGSAWLDAGATLAEVSRLLGHANVEITARVYTHAIRGREHRVTAIDRSAAMIMLPSITQELRTAA